MGYSEDDWKSRVAQRSDFAAGLVHLTRDNANLKVIDVLIKILSEQRLIGSSTDSGFIVGDRCGSGLIEATKNGGDALESSFCCRSCGHTKAYEEIISQVVSEYYAGEVYLSYTDGGDSPIIDCPECNGIYLYEEGICSSCGHTAEHTCQRCGSPIMPEELSEEPFCGYCAHMIFKDD